MDWMSCLNSVLEYIENNLTDEIDNQTISDSVCLSPFYLQKSFQIVTGYTLSEYVRNRRLYESAVRLKTTGDKVIDVAFDYGYDTPESFTKAFVRFHGVTPSEVKNGATFKKFLPLTIKLTISGGDKMDYKVEQMDGFKVIGFERVFSSETSYEKIPQFWDEINEKYLSCQGKNDELSKAIVENAIGEYGICIDDMGAKEFRYIIAGKYNGGAVPKGLTVYELPSGLWAKFSCVGKMPKALQNVNDQIFDSWLPQNNEYAFCGNCNVEWYSNGNVDSDDYQSAIWIPVKSIKK